MAVASLNKLEAKDEMAEESTEVGRTTTGGTAVNVVWRFTVVVETSTDEAVSVLVGAASVVVADGSTIVVVVLSTAVVLVSVTTTVVVGSAGSPVWPGNGGRVKVVVIPSETVITTDWAIAEAAKAARRAKRAIASDLLLLDE